MTMNLRPTPRQTIFGLCFILSGILGGKDFCHFLELGVKLWREVDAAHFRLSEHGAAGA